jgi:hypothetical protein
MRTLLAVAVVVLVALALVLGLCASTTAAQTNTGRGQAVPARAAQKKTQPETVTPAPLSDGFIRPATRAFTTIKESTADLLLKKGPTPADDRVSEADQAASTPADKAFVVAIKDYKGRKTAFSAIYDIKKLTAQIEAKTGGPGVPDWKCAPFEDRDICPSFQAAVKTLLAADRDLAKLQNAIEDCEDSLASALKAKTFDSAPTCSDSSKSESK